MQLPEHMLAIFQRKLLKMQPLEHTLAIFGPKLLKMQSPEHMVVLKVRGVVFKVRSPAATFPKVSGGRSQSPKPNHEIPKGVPGDPLEGPGLGYEVFARLGQESGQASQF